MKDINIDVNNDANNDVKKISIWEDRFEERPTNIRIGSRGIIIEKGNILLSYESKKDWYFIPGGGIEDGETLEEGCAREIAEESGYTVEVIRELICADGYYKERIFRNHFFLCRRTGKTERHLTQQEKADGLVPRWVPLKEAIRIFSGYWLYEKSQEALCESYLRDYLVLKSFLE